MVVGEFTQETDLLIIGGGPGGYHAAFRAAANGISTTIVDASGKLGGICLHCGCIPSKTYLYMAELLHTSSLAGQMGIKFDKPKLDIDKMRGWKEHVVEKLAGGLEQLCKKHKVEKISGKARFESRGTVAVEGAEASRIKFKRAIIATGSKPIRLKGIEVDSENVIDSTGALELPSVPKTMLVIGGGYIGLELGQVYAGFGSEVTVVEMLPHLLPGADKDLTRPLIKRLKEQFEEVCLETKVTGMKEVKGGIDVEFDGKSVPSSKKFEKVLVSVGRFPNSRELELSKAGVETDERGFIKVDANFKTTTESIYAIGDVIGNPMLAHKALNEGTVLADRLAGKNEVFEPRAIPAVVFTDPEIAWAGVTESQAKEQGLDITVKKIPWGASGRAVAVGRTDGTTKLIFEKGSNRLLGMGICGVHAGEMIAEGVHAIEMGAVAYDLASTIHPHPTLSEMVAEVAHQMG